MRPSEELLLELSRAAIKISQLSEDIRYFSDKQIREQNYAERRQRWQDFDMIQIEITERLAAYDKFYNDVSCLFAEGVEFQILQRSLIEFQKKYLRFLNGKLIP